MFDFGHLVRRYVQRYDVGEVLNLADVRPPMFKMLNFFSRSLNLSSYISS